MVSLINKLNIIFDWRNAMPIRYESNIDEMWQSYSTAFKHLSWLDTLCVMYEDLSAADT